MTWSTDAAATGTGSPADPRLERRPRTGRRAPTERIKPSYEGPPAAALVAVVAVVVGLTGCAAASSASPATLSPATGSFRPTQPPAPRTGRSLQPAGTAVATLDRLPIKGRAPKTGYARAQFGPAWSDDVDVAYGHDGCDTRNNILNRDLTDTGYKPGTRDCLVTAGNLSDPYTGRTIHFVRGPDTSPAVEIDHVVALSNAWQTGAQQLSPARRRDLANDPLNLLAVDGPTNQAKGDGDSATWLPSNKTIRCAYVARQVAVKARYELWVTSAENAAMTRLLTTCPGQPLPTDGTTRITVTSPGPPDDAAGGPTRSTDESSDGSGPVTGDLDPRFPSCAAAKAAGYGPYRRGVDPEYNWYRDGDSDGITCE